MWIVRLALRRPYTFVVASLVIVLLAGVIISDMPKDIFPVIDIPVVSVIWSYIGMAPDEMEKRMITVCERAFSGSVNDIEHLESQCVNGVSLVKVFFHPHAKIEAAVAQLSATCQAILRIFPPGTTAPFIVRYSATNVPILQLSVSSDELSEQELYDYGLNFIRTQLYSVEGAVLPGPYGGRPRQIMVDLNPSALLARGVSPSEVSEALNLQNLIIPAGTLKMGEREYNVRLNSSPAVVEALNQMPVKQSNGATVYIRDIAQVRDGYAVQTNIVRENSKRSTLLTVLKNGGASTLDVVRKIKEALKRVRQTLPQSLKINPLFDQSLFVRASLVGVLTEATIAAVLTGLMILLFLGSWRSTLIVAISIPMSILCSIVVLGFLGQTLNIMTLGGLALAVGILVDDSTVEIENIHRNLGQGKEMNRAILDGAQQIAVPAFVSSLAICIVFAPVVFLEGAAKFLFVPLAMSVVFAMLASYLLSRTLVPTLVKYLLRSEISLYREGEHPSGGRGLIWAVHRSWNRLFEAFRERYHGMLGWVIDHRELSIGLFLAFTLASFLIFPLIGQDFFPQVDAGQFRLHVRAPAGTRLETTEVLFQEVEDEIREIIPPSELGNMLDNIGMPAGGYNLAWSDSATVSAGDGEILVSLQEHHQRSTWDYVKEIRRRLPRKFPGVEFFLQASDMVSQILNFGLPAPIDIQVVGRDPRTYQVAREIEAALKRVPGAVDVHIHQPMGAPEIELEVDRTKALELGVSQQDIANDVLVSLSGTSQTAPNYWLNPQNGVNYQIIVQTPQHQMKSMMNLISTPIASRTNGSFQLLANLAATKRGTGMIVVNHYNVQPVYDIYASTQGRDLEGVAKGIDRIIEEVKPKLPPGCFIMVRGQVGSMRSSFRGLAGGLVFAILLVYFLMVVNFQSWTDPLIIAAALPAALAGILWMLLVTQTTISVPALMGAIMGIGVATANSILMVTFANDRRKEGADARQAALDAGFTRLRPVLMTALAMIIGMVPMALGIGEGGEQNAPLARAVIGALLLATVSTLFFVPAVYAVLRRKPLKPLEVIPE